MGGATGRTEGKEFGETEVGKCVCLTADGALGAQMETGLRRPIPEDNAHTENERLWQAQPLNLENGRFIQMSSMPLPVGLLGREAEV